MDEHSVLVVANERITMGQTVVVENGAALLWRKGMNTGKSVVCTALQNASEGDKFLAGGVDYSTFKTGIECWLKPEAT